MMAWFLIALIGSGDNINIELGGQYRTEKECNAARAEVLKELPEGKPIAVGCVAQKLKSA